MSEKTIFKQIIDGELPADVVYQDELCLALRGLDYGCRIQQLFDVVQRRSWMIGKCNFSRGSGQRCAWKYAKCHTCFGAIEGKIQSSLALTLRNSYIAYKVA